MCMSVIFFFCFIEGFHGGHVGGLKQWNSFEKIDRISQGRENVLFLPSNMAAMTSHENAPFNNLNTEDCVSTFIVLSAWIHWIQIFLQ